MAKGTLTAPPAFVTKLVVALRKDLPGADVTTEQIRGRRYRFVVVADQFDGVGHPERQQHVWDLAERVVAGKDLLDVGMILTIAPEELSSAEQA